MKILGYGIDLERMDRFDARVSLIDDYLISKFLTPSEYEEYSKITTANGRTRFLCSHWAAKEAVFKALNAKNEPLNKINISRLPNGHLVYKPLKSGIIGEISVTYSEGFCAVACVLLELDNVVSKNAHKHAHKHPNKHLNFAHEKAHKYNSNNFSQKLLDEDLKKSASSFLEEWKKEIKHEIKQEFNKSFETVKKELVRDKIDYLNSSPTQKLFVRTHQSDDLIEELVKGNLWKKPNSDHVQKYKKHIKQIHDSKNKK